MKNLLISVAAAIIIAIVGLYFMRWYPYRTDQAIVYLAMVVGGGCCWIGLNLRKK